MNSKLVFLLGLATLAATQWVPDDGNNQTFPGISMSVDLSVLSQAKDVYLQTILKKINGLALPELTLPAGDGYIRKNRVFIKLKPNKVNLTTNDKNDSFSVNIRDLYLFVRSQDFRYNFWFVPIKATLDVQVANVNLDFEVQFATANVTWFNNDTKKNETRVVPQMNVPTCNL